VGGPRYPLVIAPERGPLLREPQTQKGVRAYLATKLAITPAPTSPLAHSSLKREGAGPLTCEPQSRKGARSSYLAHRASYAPHSIS
jgi:hypothetical protein